MISNRENTSEFSEKVVLDVIEEVKSKLETESNVKEIVMKSNKSRKKKDIEIVKVDENKEQPKRKNKWFEHLALTRTNNPGLSYKEQRKLAQETYKK